MESDPTESDPELIQLQKHLEALDTAKATIREWASLETTVRDYITQHIGKPLVMLTYYNDVDADRPMTSTMDALATILGVNLEIYVQAYEEEIADRIALMKSKPLILVHHFKGGDTKTIRMVNVAYDPAEPENLNHFNRLEETQDFTKAAHHVEEHFEEEYGAVVTEEGYDISLPFATLATFAGNVADGAAWIAQTMTTDVQAEAKRLRENDAFITEKEEVAKQARNADVSAEEQADVNQKLDQLHDELAETQAILHHLQEKQSHAQPTVSSSAAQSSSRVDLSDSTQKQNDRQTKVTWDATWDATGESAAASSSAPYGQTPLTWQKDGLTDAHHETALIVGMHKLSHVLTQIEDFGNAHPWAKQGLIYTLKGVEYAARGFYYVKAVAAGSAMGVGVCGPIAAHPAGAAVCSVGGGAAGLVAAWGSEHAMASGLEAGIDQTAKVVGRQGRNAEEKAAFEESIHNTAFYIGAIATVLGVKNVAGKVKTKSTAVEQSALKGEYRAVKGHHVHAKKAFEGHVNYDPQKGFSISEELMSTYGVKHSVITGVQQRRFNELAKSGRSNTIYEHSKIAVEALIEAGMPKNTARSLVAESLNNLRMMNVRNPVNIPWN